MKKRGLNLLIKICAIVTCAVIVSCALTFLTFSKFGIEAFADIKSKELLSKTEYIAEVSAPYLEGKISDQTYQYVLGDGNDIWDATLYGFNAKGQIFVRSKQDGNKNESEEKINLAKQRLSEVLDGQRVNDIEGLVIGIPVVSSYGNVIGAVFMVKPMSEVTKAVKSVRNALIMCSVMSLAIMMIPVYFAANNIVKPIQKMTKAALEMSVGHFNTVAEEKGTNEIASLGRSLNILSRSLSRSIGDLTAERNKLRDILDVMSDGVIAFDSNGNIVQFNPAAVRLLGGGKRIPIDCAPMRTLLEKINENEDKATFEFDIRRNEKILRAVITRTEVCGSDGIAILVVIRDVTEAERYEQSRKDYVANVSHELRTPVASIKGIAEALCDGLVNEEDCKHYYGYLYKESTRLSRLIDDLLELSRLQSGKLSFEKRRTDIYELVMQVSERFCDMAAENGMSIATVCDENISYAYTNEDRAEQVLIVILDNAIKHSQSEIITVKAEETDSRIIVSVSNNGSISEDDLPHLFERFYKVDKSHSGKGTGLGLSIANEIMEIMGEKIWVTSQDGVVTFAFSLAKQINAIVPANYNK